MHVSQKVYYNHEKRHMVERDFPKEEIEFNAEKENEKPQGGIDIPDVVVKALVGQMDTLDLEPVSDEELILVAMPPPPKKVQSNEAKKVPQPPPMNKNGYCLPSERQQDFFVDDRQLFWRPYCDDLFKSIL